MRLIHPWYSHGQRASKPSTLKGCVGTLPEEYVPNVPLPRVPVCQSAPPHQVHTVPGYYDVPYGVPTYDTLRSIVESAAYVFSPAWQAIAIYT